VLLSESLSGYLFLVAKITRIVMIHYADVANALLVREIQPSEGSENPIPCGNSFWAATDPAFANNGGIPPGFFPKVYQFFYLRR
jgi:hypothetical protein